MSLKTLYNDFYGDETRWWVGVVESVNDPIKQGRVRVRIYGIHSASSEDIPASALPWAQVLAPVTQGGTSGLNGTPVGIQPYAQVFGIFLDGRHSQLPLVLGSIPRVDGQKPDMTQAAPAGGRGMPAGAPGVTPAAGVAPVDYGGETPHGGKDYSNIKLEGGDNVEKAYNFLEKVFRADFGLPNSKELAAGFVGNFMMESGPKLNPLIENGIGAVGIAQWLGDRRTKLTQYGQAKGLELFSTSRGNYKVPDIQAQLSYVAHELQTLQWLKFKDWAPQSTTAAIAADRIEAFYEISEVSCAKWKDLPSGKVIWKFAPYEERRKQKFPHLEQRIGYAEAVYKKFATTGSTSSGGPQ